MKTSRQPHGDTRCFRLYIGNGNWVNLSPDTTRDLLNIYERGTATRYQLIPGLVLDILPHDVDCNSKNTDLPCLMRADLCYDQQDETRTQQELSRYVKSLLETQGIIDAFPPAKTSDPLPPITSLPTHRHLSMVPTPLCVARRSHRTGKETSPALFSTGSSPSLSSAASSSASEYGKRPRPTTRRPRRRSIRPSVGTASSKTVSVTSLASTGSLVSLSNQSGQPSWSREEDMAQGDNLTSLSGPAPFHALKHDMRGSEGHMAASFFSGSELPNHFVLPHPPSDMTLLPSPEEKHDHQRSPVMREGWMERDMWADAAFAAAAAVAEVAVAASTAAPCDLAGYPSFPLGYPGHSSAYSASVVMPLSTDPPKYDLSLLQLSTSSSITGTTSALHDTSSHLCHAFGETTNAMLTTTAITPAQRQQSASHDVIPHSSTGHFRCPENYCDYANQSKVSTDQSISPTSVSDAMKPAIASQRRASSLSAVSL